MRKEITINGENTTYTATIEKNGILIEINTEKFFFENVHVDHENIFLKFNGALKTITHFVAGGKIFCDIDGKTFTLNKSEKKFSKTSVGHGQGLISPMPGKIVKVCHKIGDLVKAGDAIIVMEAMKMEHTLSAPKAGVILAIHAAEGSLVEGGLNLVELGDVDDAKES